MQNTFPRIINPTAFFEALVPRKVQIYGAKLDPGRCPGGFRFPYLRASARAEARRGGTQECERRFLKRAYGTCTFRMKGVFRSAKKKLRIFEKSKIFLRRRYPGQEKAAPFSIFRRIMRRKILAFSKKRSFSSR